MDVDRALWQLEQHDLVKAELHLAAGRAIETVYADRLEEHVERLAYHYDRTGDSERAATFLFRAGEKSRRAHLNDEALEGLRRALTRVEELDGDEPGAREERRLLRSRIHESTGDVLELVGRHDEAFDSYQRALEHRLPPERLARGRILRKAGGSRQIQRRKQEALAVFDQAVESLGEPPADSDPEWDEERSAIELGKIMLVYFTSSPEELADQIERSRMLVEERGSMLQRAWLFNSLALLGLRRERYVASPQTVDHARAGYESTLQTEARAESSDIHFIYAFSLLWADRLEEAERHLLEILEEADRVGYATVQARCVAYLALIGRKRGDIEATRSWAERTLEIARAGGLPEYEAAAEANLAWAALREGDLERAAAGARRAFDQGNITGGAYRVLAWITAWPLLGVSLAQGNLKQALELARLLLAPESQPAPAPVAAALQEAVAAADAGSLEVARARLADAAEAARQPGYL